MSTQEKVSEPTLTSETITTSSSAVNDAPSQLKEPSKSVAPTPVPPVPSTSSSSSSSGGHAVRPTPTLPTIPLSWQCFSSLMFCGPQKMADSTMVCIAPSDIGCFSKSAHLPLVLSSPYSALVREKLLAVRVKAISSQLLSDGDHTKSSTSSTKMDVEEGNGEEEDDEANALTKVTKSMLLLAQSQSKNKGEEGQNLTDLALWALQRQARATLAESYAKCYDIVSSTENNITMANSSSSSAAAGVGALGVSPLTATSRVLMLTGGLSSGGMHVPSATGLANVVSQLVGRKQFTRTRRQQKRDLKVFERDEKKRRTDLQKLRTMREQEYLKELLAHREDFFRFHKTKRADAKKAAFAVKAWQETADSRKEKMELRYEAARVKALKENDMEAYAKLLQETKNDRLHYLLNQTDTYLATINKMVQEQRDMGDDDNHNNASAARSSASASAGAGSSVVMVNSAFTGGSSDDLAAVTKSYYESTHNHQVNEKVQQPSMLKGGDLKEYQLSGLQWLVSLYNNNLNGILADEMGLGKTIQAISLLAYVMEFKHNKGPFLVIVPLSTLSNWVNELTKWVPDMIKVVYKGPPNVRKQIYNDEVKYGQFNVLLTTYEYIMKDRAQLKKQVWQYIIVDEGHRMKNAQSKFAQTLGTSYQSRHRVLLTGTPLQNNLPELWSLLNFLLPKIFSSVDTFDQWFNKPFAAFKEQGKAAQASSASGGDGGLGDEEGAPASLSQEEQLLIVHRLHEVLRPFVLRRIKDQVLDQLPEKTERVLRCELSPWQRKLYRAIHTRNMATAAALSGGAAGLSKADKDKLAAESSSSGMNNTIMQLRKVCNHPYLFLNHYQRDEDIIRSSGKFELLDRMLPKLRQAGHRVLMFSQMTQVMSILEDYFRLRGFTSLRLDGTTSSEEREKRMYMFNDPDSPYFIFLLSTRAGGLGLNLATADTVILFDSDWNPMMDAQAQDRAHRIGQKNEVRVFRLVTNTVVEEKILARATDKRNLNGLVVEAGKFNESKGSSSSSSSSGPGAGDLMDPDNDAGDVDSNRQMMESLLKEYSAGGGATVASSFDRDKGGGEGGDGVGEEGEGGGGGCDDDQVDAEVPDDDAINEMMSTHDSELLLYQQMDRQRRLDEEKRWADQQRYLGNTGPRNGRPPPEPMRSKLMEMNERPSWILTTSWSHKHAQLDVVMMTDGDGTYVPPSKVKGKRGRKSKSEIAARLAAAAAGGLYASDHDNDAEGALAGFDDEDDYDEEDGVMMGGKLMRKRKEVTYDDGLTDRQFVRAVEKATLAEEKASQQEKEREKQARLTKSSGGKADKADKAERGGGSTGSSVGPIMTEAIAEGLLTILKDLQKLTRVEDGSQLADLFLDKPDRKLYPDYYLVVPRPISFKEVTVKLRKTCNGGSGGYASVEEVETDFALMSHNARTFNLDSSLVFGDCELIREELHERTRQLRRAHGLPPPPPSAVISAHMSSSASAAGVPPCVARPPLPEKTHIIYTTCASAAHTQQPPHKPLSLSLSLANQQPPYVENFSSSSSSSSSTGNRSLSRNGGGNSNRSSLDCLPRAAADVDDDDLDNVLTEALSSPEQPSAAKKKRGRPSSSQSTDVTGAEEEEEETAVVGTVATASRIKKRKRSFGDLDNLNGDIDDDQKSRSSSNKLSLSLQQAAQPPPAKKKAIALSNTATGTGKSKGQGASSSLTLNLSSAGTGKGKK